MKLTESELYISAWSNTGQFLGAEIFTLAGIPEKMPPEAKEYQEDSVPLPEQGHETEMYVITNSHGINGAALILYDDILQSAADKFDDDLYILPSSIHEVIAVSASDKDADELAEIVFDVNMNKLILEERLSNQVYFYDREARKLTCATDTPNKLLEQLAS